MKTVCSRLLVLAFAFVGHGPFALGVPATSTIVQSLTAPQQTILSTDGLFVGTNTPMFGAEFNRFDPALGSLASVKVELDSEWSIFGVGGGEFGGGGVYVYGGIKWDGEVLAEIHANPSFPVVIPFTPFYKPFDIDRLLSPPPSKFEGLGVGTMEFPSALGEFAYFVAPGTNGGNLGLEQLTLTLTYVYIPVPEPASAALVAAGAMALHRAKRRGRMAKRLTSSS